MGPKDAEKTPRDRKRPRKPKAAAPLEKKKRPPEVDLVERISSVPSILQVVSKLTGMRFVAVARVTEQRWAACAVFDRMNFGLVPGGELEVATTVCSEIRDRRKAIVLEHVSQN